MGTTALSSPTALASMAGDIWRDNLYQLVAQSQFSFLQSMLPLTVTLSSSFEEPRSRCAILLDLFAETLVRKIMQDHSVQMGDTYAFKDCLECFDSTLAQGSSKRIGLFMVAMWNQQIMYLVFFSPRWLAHRVT